MNKLSQEIYIMRIWQEGTHAPWRISITDTRSQEKKHFASLEGLVSFLQERLKDTPCDKIS
jgi:hypothetical protein